MSQPPLRFAAIGLNHNHIYGQAGLMLKAGAEFVSYYAKEPELAVPFGQMFPMARQASSEAEILEDPAIALVLSAGIPAGRAPLGIRVMQHGKDYCGAMVRR